eukprot:TRINITY_DN7219_c0_g1_i1.p2 TRINITY_DN7219_c0_g1~~TRINITY_DN7219_c0_g1_i1.p2  ORF type:complete len:110 (-),score=0.69 TRINITY_DN7219_c0_g1_i1:85-414(-)
MPSCQEVTTGSQMREPPRDPRYYKIMQMMYDNGYRPCPDPQEEAAVRPANSIWNLCRTPRPRPPQPKTWFYTPARFAELKSEVLATFDEDVARAPKGPDAAAPKPLELP